MIKNYVSNVGIEVSEIPIWEAVSRHNFRNANKKQSFQKTRKMHKPFFGFLVSRCFSKKGSLFSTN